MSHLHLWSRLILHALLQPAKGGALKVLALLWLCCQCFYIVYGLGLMMTMSSTKKEKPWVISEEKHDFYCESDYSTVSIQPTETGLCLKTWHKGPIHLHKVSTLPTEKRKGNHNPAHTDCSTGQSKKSCVKTQKLSSQMMLSLTLITQLSCKV